jgi:hypothetical protein
MEAHIILKKVTHLVLGEILFLQILNRNIGQETKVVEVTFSLSFKEGDVPWILKKDDLSMVKMLY